MAKPWAKYEIGYIDHDKFLALNSNAICLWVEGKNYADSKLTDGLLPSYVVKHWRFYSKKSVDLLTASCGLKPGTDEAYQPLWLIVEGFGYQMHDYLEHNDCREKALVRIGNSEDARAQNRVTKSLSRDTGLVQLIRRRDGDDCRYCGRAVNWSDRRGAGAGTYDHVDPSGPDSLANVVIACRGCNSRKGERSLEQIAEFGMVLRPAPIKPEPSPIKPEPSRDQAPIKPEPSRDQAQTAPDQALLRRQKTDPDPERAEEPKKSGGVSARSKRPIYQSDRFAVFEWQFDEISQTLGPQLDAFDLHGFFDALTQQSRDSGLVIPSDREARWKWLQAQVEAEARRRGLPMADASSAAAPTNKRIAGLAAGTQAFLNRRQA